ncbi:MAG TPA: 23S rRNA (guanosine(2251)-2'-O)-methyltransferase RlmB [Elusimicrobiales bacterium]|nr:23S rRNA (guanosine(2251)-2'-O)-methyltransferase RlmB [Elusimicrobiales bacterium]
MSNQKDVICGIHPVTHILVKRSRSVFTLFVDEGKTNPKVSRVVKLAKRQKIKVLRKTTRDLDRLSSNSNHQGVVAYVEPINKLTLHEAISLDKNKKKSMWLAVDEITDPQNLGAMIRTAVSLDVKYIALSHHRTSGITPSVFKSASGALEDINIVEVSNLNWALLTLKENGYWIYGADAKGQHIGKTNYNTPSVLVIGSEGKGIRPQTKKHCDELVSIPQNSKVESLNAACAASIILYDMFSKIKAQK